MKKLFVKGALLTAAAVAAVSQAGAASGTRGGGQTVDINGRLSLRDLVDKTICKWTEASALRDSLPELNKILDKLGSVHWYYKSAIRSEAGHLRVCETQGTLSRIDPMDQDGLTISENIKGDQAAIRWDDKIYLDRKIFDRMDAKNQAYLLLHEVMHSFIPLTEPQRNIKLRSFVNSVQEFVQGRISGDELLRQMELNGVDLPQLKDLGFLDVLRPQMEQLHSDDKVQRMAGAVALQGFEYDLRQREAVSSLDLTRLDRDSEAALKSFWSAIATCDVQSVRTLMEVVKVDGRSRETTLTWVVGPDGKTSAQVVDAMLEDPILRMMRRSSSNYKMGLDDAACVKTLEYLLSVNTRLGRMEEISDEAPTRGWGSVVRVYSPKMWAVYADIIQKVKAEAESKRQAALAAALDTCSTNAWCVKEVLVDIQDFMTNKFYQGQKTHSLSFPVGKVSPVDVNPEELPTILDNLFARDNLNLDYARKEKELTRSPLLGQRIKDKLTEQKNKR